MVLHKWKGKGTVTRREEQRVLEQAGFLCFATRGVVCEAVMSILCSYYQSLTTYTDVGL